MGKKYLIAVDESCHAKNALRYASGYYSQSGKTQFTLINIQPIVSDYYTQESKKDPKMNAALVHLNSNSETHSGKLLKKSKEILVREGIASADIETVSQFRTLGLTRDILEFSHKNQCDAIFAGRRGLSRLKKLFMGSNSAKLMEYSGNTPVCIVDGKVRPHNFLVALDMGASSLSIIDFISRLFEGSYDFYFTFFHVLEDFGLDRIVPLSPDLGEIKEIFEAHRKQAIERLIDEIKQGLVKTNAEANRFEIKITRRTTKTAKMIIEEVESNGYDTVVLGRTGRGNAFYFGSVSRYVSERLTDHALWLIG